jgi:hypothetical protein
VSLSRTYTCAALCAGEVRADTNLTSNYFKHARYFISERKRLEAGHYRGTEKPLLPRQ